MKKMVILLIALTLSTFVMAQEKTKIKEVGLTFRNHAISKILDQIQDSHIKLVQLLHGFIRVWRKLTLIFITNYSCY